MSLARLHTGCAQQIRVLGQDAPYVSWVLGFGLEFGSLSQGLGDFLME
jgi:hypothetical protein